MNNMYLVEQGSRRVGTLQHQHVDVRSGVRNSALKKQKKYKYKNGQELHPFQKTESRSNVTSQRAQLNLHPYACI